MTPFWKKARGDHLLTAIVLTSVILNWIIINTVYKNEDPILITPWFLGSCLISILIPVVFVPSDWIDFENKIPPGTFWEELLS